MRIYSWNVNGIRSAEVSFLSFIKNYKPDILLLQEVRAHPDQISYFVKNIAGYNSFFNDSGRAGYGGTAVYYKKKLSIGVETKLRFGILWDEGRCILIKIGDIYILNVYVPNGNSSEDRLEYKFKFYDDLTNLLSQWRKEGRKVVLGGDLNVAHTEKDLFAPQSARNSGFLKEEREWMSSILDLGFIDTFRLFNQEGGNYTWWSMRDPTRKSNKGWRYDYLIVSEDLETRVKKSEILKDVFGSDHCPILMNITSR